MGLLQRDATPGQPGGRMPMKGQWQGEHILPTLFQGNKRMYKSYMKNSIIYDIFKVLEHLFISILAEGAEF